MNVCPITYQEIAEGEKYSSAGLKLLSPGLSNLHDLPYSAEEQRQEAVARAVKMSIQGVQPKLSARLNAAKQSFEVVDIHGQYILKPQSHLYPQLPENEDLSMRLASEAGIEAPLHRLVYSKDGTVTYFIKRFDRIGRNKKLSLEDFAQLSGKTRDTKYDSSMERIVGIVDQYCTFPLLEKIKLLRLTLFNFLIGNEDMHLKNFSLIRRNGIVELSPAYDLINTTLVLRDAEEIALPLNGKKRNLTRTILIDYFARARLQLNPTVIQKVLDDVTHGMKQWDTLIARSFLSDDFKERYLKLVNERRGRMEL